MEHKIVSDLLLLMTSTALLVTLMHRLGLSAIVGYLTAGLLFGPYALQVLHDVESIHWFAEIGVMLLMFTIGLEFSLPKLLASRRLVLGLGGVQVIVLTSLFAGLLVLMEMHWGLAIVLGGAFAMSSTAIVLKQLAEQGEHNSTHGRIATGILLFQDIAAIPFLVLLPILGTEGAELAGHLSSDTFMAVAIFLLLALAGRRLLPRMLHWVADTHSAELFMLTVLVLALSAAFLTMLAGLSPTLGAFMAGMLLGETHFRHQVEADIRPFRDLMLGIFFISIGMQLDPGVLLSDMGLILLLVLALTLIKGLMMWPLIRYFGYTPSESLRAAIVLAQGGEFGLLLVSQVISMQLVASPLLQPLLSALIISMLAAPMLVRLNGRISQLLLKSSRQDKLLPDTLPVDFTEDYQEHVIICGYGRLGQGIDRILGEMDTDRIIIDQNARLVQQYRNDHPGILFGDATNPRLLELAHIRSASALAITFEDEAVAEQIIHHVQRLNPNLPILLRGRLDAPPPYALDE